ncbi:MAG: hypothetical protein D6720_03100, partial [Gammaproteobacteria bacterium]
DRQRHALQTRVATGWAPDHPVRGLSLPTREKHLFALLLATRRPLWVRQDNWDKYAPYLTPLPLDDTARRGFYALPLFAGPRPLGVLYADGGSLSADGFQRFQKAGRALEERIAASRRSAA